MAETVSIICYSSSIMIFLCKKAVYLLLSLPRDVCDFLQALIILIVGEFQGCSYQRTCESI